MFDKIESQLQPIIYKTAERFILLNDRSRFDTIFEVVENYVINNEGIIGGSSGIDILTETEKNKDSYMYEIYIENPDSHSKKLIDMIYDQDHRNVNKDTLKLETKMMNRIYEILIEGRVIVRINALIDYRGIKLFLLLNPVRAHGYFAEEDKVYVMSPEMQLLDIYRRLYNPYPAEGAISYDSYATLMKNENKLYEIISGEIHERASGIEEDIMSITRADGGAGRINSPASIAESIARQLMNESANMNSVIVGDYALNQILSDYPHRQRLQILTGEDPEYIRDFVQHMVDRNKIAYGNVKLVKYNLNIPNDMQMIKHSMYFVPKGGKDAKQHFICDIFNSLTYEQVPYVLNDDDSAINTIAKGIKWANILVCLRFKFIDLYVSRLVNNIREGKDEFILKKISHIAWSIDFIREKINMMIDADPEKVFQTENYAGVFIPPNIILRKTLEEMPGGRKFYKNYYPTTKKLSEIEIKYVV